MQDSQMCLPKVYDEAEQVRLLFVLKIEQRALHIF